MTFNPSAGAKLTAARRRPLGRLGEKQFPRRVRDALLELHAAVAEDLKELAKHALMEINDSLFRNAEQARNNAEQSRCFESMRMIQQQENAVIARLLARIESDHAAAPWAPQSAPTPSFDSFSGGLSLVEEHVLDEELAMQEIASRATIRFSEPLHLLGQRYAVLVATAAIEPEQLPAGPDALAAALGEAIAVVPLPLDHRLELFRIIERQALARLGMLYGKLNTVCVARRILPNLGLTVRRNAPTAASQATPNAAAVEARPSPPDDGGPAEPAIPAEVPAPAAYVPQPGFHQAPGVGYTPPVAAAPPQRGAFPATATAPPSPGATAQPPAPLGVADFAPRQTSETLAALAADLSRFPGLAGLMQPVVGFPELPAPPPADPVEELKLVDTLLDLLSQRRAALGQQVPATASAGVTPFGIQSALANIQRQRHATRNADTPTRSGIQALREDLLAQLRGFVPPGQTPQLGAPEQDAIELLEMLIGELADEHDQAHPVRELLARLEVPLLRVALRDRAFFSSPGHPARKMLNAISMSGRFWVDEHGEDSLLFTRLRAMVDRIVRDYDDDLTVFDDLLEDLNGFLSTLSRKSDVAEKRHIETARGRERLESARRSAKAAINNLLEGRETATIVRTLLEQTWADVLSLTILKHGDEPQRLDRVLSTANRLIQALDPRQPPISDRAREILTEDLVAGLTQVGYHDEDARLVADRLFDADRAGRDGVPVSLTEIAIKLKSRTRLGSDVPAEGAGGAEDPSGTAAGETPATRIILTEAEAAVRRHLEQTPFGTWFEFVLTGDRRSRRKLAWFSPMSGRCLFVNARGARTDEMSLDDLARRIAAGDIVVVRAETEGDVEKAWTRITNSLKRAVGLLPAKPVPA